MNMGVASLYQFVCGGTATRINSSRFSMKISGSAVSIKRDMSRTASMEISEDGDC
jgi:hypothetical protein